jgi:hypothetical protein
MVKNIIHSPSGAGKVLPVQNILEIHHVGGQLGCKKQLIVNS